MSSRLWLRRPQKVVLGVPSSHLSGHCVYRAAPLSQPDTFQVQIDIGAKSDPICSKANPGENRPNVTPLSSQNSTSTWLTRILCLMWTISSRGRSKRNLFPESQSHGKGVLGRAAIGMHS